MVINLSDLPIALADSPVAYLSPLNKKKDDRTLVALSRDASPGGIGQKLWRSTSFIVYPTPLTVRMISLRPPTASMLSRIW